MVSLAAAPNIDLKSHLREEKQEITFTEVEVSPGAPLKGRLTGIPRRIKDSCADFYNSIQKWNALCIQGTSLLRKIVDCRLQARNSEEQNDNTEDSSCETLQDRKRKEHRIELQEHCIHLQELIEEMTETVSKMTTIVDHLQAVSELSFHQSASYNDIPDIVFQTWPADRFYITTRNILERYKEELTLKNSIMEEISFLTDQNQMDFFIIAWSHEPYITCETNELLEAIVKETGFLKAN